MSKSYFLSSPLAKVDSEKSETKAICLKGTALKEFINKMANLIIANGLLVAYNNQVYSFDGTIYKPLNEFRFNQWIFQEALKQDVLLSMQNCQSVIQSAALRCPIFNGEANGENYTVFRNCSVSNLDGQVVQYPPNYFATICIEANYLQDATLYHPITDAFLDTICGGESELIIRHWEFWGYVLSSDARAKIIPFLYGSTGNNGKSTELAMLKALLSEGSVDNMPMCTFLSEFGKNRLRNLRMEISADEGEINLKSRDIGYLKSFSGHDDMTANVKFKDFVTFTSTCKIVIASNNNIGMAYSAVDPAFTRRLLTIPYPVCIPKEQQDPYILYKLLEEKDAIVTEAFRHYLKLRARNYTFTDCGKYEMPQPMYMSPLTPEYDAVRNFTSSFCDFSDTETFTSTQELYNIFSSLYAGIFKDITGFSQAFYLVNNDRLKKDRKRHNGENIRGFYGVRLNTNN